MSRSAAQRASRRLKRQMKPTFPFTKLPAELQLLVRLTNITIFLRKLLQWSPHVRTLFLCYSETALRDILAQMPPPTSCFLRLSWALQNATKENFGHGKMLDLIRCSDPLKYPLETIKSFIDLIIEVNTAVELVAQAMHTAMATFVDPHTVVAAISLSSTEHTRIACSLYIIQIYHHLSSSMPDNGSDRLAEFPAMFLRGLEPWQIEQAVSVELCLEVCRCFGQSVIYTMMDERYTSIEYLAEKSLYIRKYLDIAKLPFVSFESAAMIVRQSQPLWMREHDDVGPQLSVLQDITQLSKHAWKMYISITGIRRLGYQRWYLGIGLLFWDQNRLVNWNLIDQDDLVAAYEEFQLRPEVVNLAPERFWSVHHDHCRKLLLMEQAKARQIIEWARCLVQCTLVAWLYQKTVVSRTANGDPLLPHKYIYPGFVCEVCEMDGHSGDTCEEKDWSDGESDKLSPFHYDAILYSQGRRAFLDSLQ